MPAPNRGRQGYGDVPEPSPIEPLSPRLVFAALRRRRLILLANFLLWPLFAFIAIKQVTPHYTAVGTLIYEPSEYKVRELQSILQTDPTTEAVMASQAEILRGLRVVEEVVKRGNLYDDPEFNPSLRPRGHLQRAIDAVTSWFRAAAPPPAPPGPTQDPSRNATLMAVQAAFDVHTVKFSRVLEVDFTAQDPQVAATAVNNAMDFYIRSQYAAKHRAVDRATALLDTRAAELRKEVSTGEVRIAAYRAKAGLAQGMHAGMDAEQISHLTEDLVHARSELGNAEAKLDAASGRAGAEAQAAIAPSVVQLRAQQDQISSEIQAQQGRLGPNHPEAIALRREYADAQRAVAAETARVVAATAAEVHAARERVSTLEQDLRNGEQAADRSAQAQVKLNAMQQDVQASRQELQAVLDRIQQTAQQAEVESSEAHEISLALPPGTPSFPRTVPLMAAAIAFGIMFGLLVVYLLELADNTLRSGEAVRAALGLPCFALLPEIRRRELGHLSADEYVARKPLSPFAEQVRTLRTGLRIGAEHPRVVAVTAARPNEGKTTVALALARSAALSGEHVLIMECDLRRPTFAVHMKAKAPIGLADCLRQQLSPHQAICTDASSGMDVMQAGRISSDLPDRFLSDTMARMLSELRQEYGLILLDSPPVHGIAEARILAGIADATLLCVRWCATPRPVVQHTLDLLEEAHAHVVGCVLTRVDAFAHVRSGYADADVYHRRRRTAQG
ncbi:MAG TPA: AAA family ATPase [Acetobacteraceae bacterium]|nr:AAA family ATPase [Acetobacteraceae bacterium]